ncbi:hypothetical protein [Dipodfec virus UOA04_Rod_881]|nr:hypothetical protein [Dipodfec virus UOA04_Rod_881]
MEEFIAYERLGTRIRRQKQTGINESSSVPPAFDVAPGEEPGDNTPFVLSDLFVGDPMQRAELFQDQVARIELSKTIANDPQVPSEAAPQGATSTPEKEGDPT